MDALLEKDLCKAIWILNKMNWKPTLTHLTSLTHISKNKLSLLLENLIDQHAIEKNNGTYALTDDGRRLITVVVTAGTFDIIHEGHIQTLENAKSFGDILVVIIARNETVKNVKGKKPILDENERRSIVSSLKPVDFAILGSKKDKYYEIEQIMPDVLALGPDQPSSIEEIEISLKARKLSPKIVRLEEYNNTGSDSSSKILKRIVKRYLSGDFRHILEK